MDPRFEDLRRCIYSEPSELDRFRQLIVNNVLATDIFDKQLQALRRSRWDKAFQRIGRTDSNIDDYVNRKATVVMEHLIQASDVAHTMQHWHIYRKWNARLFEESQQSALRERLSASIIQKIWSSNNIEGILQTAVREIGRALDASEAAIELKLEE